MLDGVTSEPGILLNIYPESMVCGLGFYPPVIPHWGSQLRHQWAGPGTTPMLTSISRRTDHTVRVIGIEPVFAGEHEWALRNSIRGMISFGILATL